MVRFSSILGTSSSKSWHQILKHLSIKVFFVNWNVWCMRPRGKITNHVFVVFIYRDKYSTFPRNCIQWLNSCILTAMRIQPVFSWSWEYSLYSHSHENTACILMAVRKHKIYHNLLIFQARGLKFCMEGHQCYTHRP